jgi:hypothetical protein
MLVIVWNSYDGQLIVNLPLTPMMPKGANDKNTILFKLYLL